MPNPVDTVIASARNFLGDRMSDNAALREQHSHGEDYQPRAMPDAVAFIERGEEAAQLLQLCYQHGVPVVPFGAARVLGELADVGAVRRPGLNDDGLAILDLRVPAGADWQALAARVDDLAGVVDHGLFRVPLAHVLVGAPDGGCAPAG